MTAGGRSAIGVRVLADLRRLQRLVTPPLVLALVGGLFLIFMALLVTAQRGGA